MKIAYFRDRGKKMDEDYLLLSFETCMPLFITQTVNARPIATTATIVPQIINVITMPVSNFTPLL